MIASFSLHDLSSPLPCAVAGSTSKPAASAVESTIKGAIIAEKPTVHWKDIVGLEKAKQALHEAIVLPSLRADLFQVRSPPSKAAGSRFFYSWMHCLVAVSTPRKICGPAVHGSAHVPVPTLCSTLCTHACYIARIHPCHPCHPCHSWLLSHVWIACIHMRQRGLFLLAIEHGHRCPNLSSRAGKWCNQ
jgi:hypothetical protein